MGETSTEPAMNHLDLTRDTPETFEGKLVSCHGRDYRIGVRLGGTRKHVHKLVNTKSGLCLHVLKVWRDGWGDLAPSQVRSQLVRSPELQGIIPVSLEVPVAGGVVELQEFCGPYSEPEDPTTGLMRDAQTLLHASQLDGAAPMYEQVLASNPCHTVALLNLGAIRAGEQDLGGAGRLVGQACDIEPNYLRYQEALITYTAQSGPRNALGMFGQMKAAFPNVHDLDDLGARLHLACGEPGPAEDLIRGCLLAGPEREELEALAQADAAARGRASVFVERARARIRSGESSGDRELLEQAHGIYDRDPVVALNLGLALQRAGEYQRAAGLLFGAAHAVPETLAKIAFANAAFCLIQSRDDGAVMMLLDRTMAWLLREHGGQVPTDLNAIPGIGVWAGDGIVIEERIALAEELVSRWVERYSKEGVLSPTAVQLAGLYRRAAQSAGKGLRAVVSRLIRSLRGWGE